MVTQALALRGVRTYGARVAAFVALTKPRIVELLLVTTLPTMVLAQKGLPPIGLILATLSGGALAAGGANATNMVIDRDIDKVMRRTGHRPLVTGQVTPRAAALFAASLEVLAFLELWHFVNLLSALLAGSAALFYVVVYTAWLKRRSTQNIVIGGAAGAVPVLVGWAAVTGSLAWPAFLLFAIVFLWTPPHFWALAVRYRNDYAAAGVPMLPAVAPAAQTARSILGYTIALMAVSVALAPVAHAGPLYLAVAVLSGAIFIGLAARLHWLAARRRVADRDAMTLFTYSITYLTILFVALGCDVFVQRIH